MTLVRPLVEYASSVWDPYTQANIQKLERDQRWAARFVMNDYHRHSSVSLMLNTLGWRPLQERRAQARLVMMFRIVNNLVDIPAQQYLQQTQSVTRGHFQPLYLPYCRTDTYRQSFFPSTIRLWNSLPNSLIVAPSLDSFKTNVQAHPLM